MSDASTRGPIEQGQIDARRALMQRLYPKSRSKPADTKTTSPAIATSALRQHERTQTGSTDVSGRKATLTSAELRRTLGLQIEPRNLFKTFCEGDANRMALAAARAVAGLEATIGVFNPLFLYGGVGRGKTHLLQAIAHEVRREHPHYKTAYATAEFIAHTFLQAVRSGSVSALKETLRDLDLLLLDDMHYLQGKNLGQEFGESLNFIIDSARQVVVASECPVTDMTDLDERIRSRLSGGIGCKIDAPELELRRAVIAAFYEAARNLDSKLAIPEPVLVYVAQMVSSSGQDLKGAFQRLVAQSQFTRQPVSLESAEAALRDLIGVQEPRHVKIEEIQRIVVQHYNVSKMDMLSSRRTRSIVKPRQIGMYLAKVLTPRSLPEIGRRFGGRDHTTVLHAVRKIEALMAKNPNLAEEIEDLKLEVLHLT